jgi:hypothetical protein
MVFGDASICSADLLLQWLRPDQIQLQANNKHVLITAFRDRDLYCLPPLVTILAVKL